MPLTRETIAALTDTEILDLLIEEASEIIQAICKAKRFGITDKNLNKADAEPNVVEIALEAAQIDTLVRTLTARHGIVYAEAASEVERRAKAQLQRGVSFGYLSERPIDSRR